MELVELQTSTITKYSLLFLLGIRCWAVRLATLRFPQVVGRNLRLNRPVKV